MVPNKTYDTITKNVDLLYEQTKKRFLVGAKKLGVASPNCRYTLKYLVDRGLINVQLPFVQWNMTKTPPNSTLYLDIYKNYQAEVTSKEKSCLTDKFSLERILGINNRKTKTDLIINKIRDVSEPVELTPIKQKEKMPVEKMENNKSNRMYDVAQRVNDHYDTNAAISYLQGKGYEIIPPGKFLDEAKSYLISNGFEVKTKEEIREIEKAYLISTMKIVEEKLVNDGYAWIGNFDNEDYCLVATSENLIKYIDEWSKDNGYIFKKKRKFIFKFKIGYE